MIARMALALCVLAELAVAVVALVVGVSNIAAGGMIIVLAITVPCSTMAVVVGWWLWSEEL